jgi:hypothetical protein
MLPAFMNRPFTRKRYPVVVDHGTTVRDYAASPTTAIFKGSIQPVDAATVDQVNRDGAEIVKTIWAQPGSDVRHFDIITLADGNYFVNGEPEAWEVGILDHVVIHLSRWDG